MKIRSGFVSNSSSSSFLIYGGELSLDTDELVEAYKRVTGKKTIENWEGKEVPVDSFAEDAEDAEPEDYEEPDTGELLEAIAEKLDMEIHYPYDTHYIGASWDSIKDNETGKQFKSRVKKALQKAFGKSFEVDTHEEAWY